MMTSFRPEINYFIISKSGINYCLFFGDKGSNAALDEVNRLTYICTSKNNFINKYFQGLHVLETHKDTHE